MNQIGDIQLNHKYTKNQYKIHLKAFEENPWVF